MKLLHLQDLIQRPHFNIYKNLKQEYQFVFFIYYPLHYWEVWNMFVIKSGCIVQRLERYVDIVEVPGSIPGAPTRLEIQFKGKNL